MYFYCPGCNTDGVVDDLITSSSGSCRICGYGSWLEMEKLPYKIIVAGSRGFGDYTLLSEKMDKWLSAIVKDHTPVIISGKAVGADTLGERYAKEHGYPVVGKVADWKRYPKRAGYLRNEEMAAIADACAVFWDGVSPGTKMMIEIARRIGLPLRMVVYGKSMA